MKMKEFAPRGGRVPGAPLRSANGRGYRSQVFGQGSAPPLPGGHAMDRIQCRRCASCILTQEDFLVLITFKTRLILTRLLWTPLIQKLLIVTLLIQIRLLQTHLIQIPLIHTHLIGNGYKLSSVNSNTVNRSST